MNKHEFNTGWKPYFLARFPQVAAWLAGMPDNGKATMDAWLDDCLSSVDLDSAKTATLALFQMGEIRDWQTLPVQIVRLVKEAEAKRAAYRLAKERPEKPMIGRPVMLGTLRRLLDAKSDDERQAILRVAFPDIDPLDGPRYHCATCQDTGYVHCYARVAMEDAMKAYREEIDWDSVRLHTASVACSCSAGNPPREELKDRARYDDQQWVRVREIGRTARIARLQAWAESYRPANYVHDFDAYNTGDDF